MLENVPPVECLFCVNGTKVPETIKFHCDPLLLVVCHQCDHALEHRVVKTLHGIILRSSVMAQRANAAAPPASTKPKAKTKPTMKVKKRKSS